MNEKNLFSLGYSINNWANNIKKNVDWISTISNIDQKVDAFIQLKKDCETLASEANEMVSLLLDNLLCLNCGTEGPKQDLQEVNLHCFHGLGYYCKHCRKRAEEHEKFTKLFKSPNV